MANETHKPIEIDFSDIEIEDVKLFVQGGARGIPEMAASSHVSPPFCISCAGGYVAPDDSSSS
ncbi:MAG TPA: hypothetical protein VIH89_16170 [Candidatus Sulfotelmatobacter sp.]|jgi:hypothetical protein